MADKTDRRGENEGHRYDMDMDCQSPDQEDLEQKESNGNAGRLATDCVNLNLNSASPCQRTLH